MGYRAYVTLNIAIIGANKVSGEMTRAFAMTGHQVFVSNRENDLPFVNIFDAFTENVHSCSMEVAAAEADCIVIATPPHDVREVAYWLGDVRKKIIVDLTANVSDNQRQVAKEAINTVGAISAITGAQHIVKVFHAAGFSQLLKPLFAGQKPDLLLAGDSRKAKELTKIIMREVEMKNFYDFGAGDTLTLFDEMVKTWKAMANAQPVNYLQPKLGV